jgi:ferredoxin
MKTKLFYFSGTGNSLAIARQISERLSDCELISISQIMTATAEPSGRITGTAVGIVAPIYMHNMPRIVSRFIETIETVEYLFMVFTGGGSLGSGLRKTRRLCARLGLPLSAVFNIPMPSNYTPHGCPTAEEQTELLATAAARVKDVVEAVEGQVVHFDDSNTSFVNTWLHPGPMYQLGYRFIPRMDAGFAVADACTACETCARVCPVGNISMVDGRPVFHHKCEQCYACLQWCPVQAIDYRADTGGIPRYHHPEINLHDIQSEHRGFGIGG